MRKIIVFLLIVMTTVFCFAGGGNQSTAGTAPKGPYDPNKVLEIKWMGFNQPGVMPMQGSIIQKEFEKLYNLKITNVLGDMYNAEQWNLLLASGTEFDIMSNGFPSQITMVESGLVRPLPIELVRQYAPDLVKVYENAMPGKWQILNTVDNVLYSLPLYAGGYTIPYGLSVRKDWYDNLGMTTIPKTLAELETFLVRFRNEDPDKNGQKDTYPLGLTGGIEFLAPYLFVGYGVNMGRWGVAKDGTPQAWEIQDEYRQALAHAKRWWDREIYDPEVLVNTRQENFDRFSSGKTAGFFGTDWMLMPTGANAFDPYLALLRNRPDLDRNNMSVYIPPVSGPNGTGTIFGNVPLNGVMMFFGRSTPDEKVIRLLSMYNDIITKKDMYETERAKVQQL